jgi:inner membrane protein involved in colicin E2 resistance
VIFLEELQKIKSSGFAAMWAHSYLAMTQMQKVTKELNKII